MEDGYAPSAVSLSTPVVHSESSRETQTVQSGYAQCVTIHVSETSGLLVICVKEYSGVAFQGNQATQSEKSIHGE